MYDTDVNGPRHRRPSNTPRSLARSVSHRKCHSSDCICGPSGHVSNGFTIEGIISAFGTKRTSRSCLRSAAYVSICPSNLRRARVLAYGRTRHPITFASITPPIAELRHTPSLQWQRYGRRYVPLLSSHKSSRGRFVGGAPWSNSLKRYCRVAIVNIHCCSPQSRYGCRAACSASKRARAFFPSSAAAVMLKKSLASFLAPPTDRHGKFPISMRSVGFLATSRRPRSQSGQILLLSCTHKW